MDSLTITITSPRVIDGFIATLNSENEGRPSPRTLQEFVTSHVEALGRSMATSKRVGIISAAEFVLRFQPAEYSAIITAAQSNAQLAALLNQLRSNAEVHFDDPRLEPGLQLLVGAGLLAPERVAELLHYDRPEVVE